MEKKNISFSVWEVLGFFWFFFFFFCAQDIASLFLIQFQHMFQEMWKNENIVYDNEKNPKSTSTFGPNEGVLTYERKSC